MMSYVLFYVLLSVFYVYSAHAITRKSRATAKQDKARALHSKHEQAVEIKITPDKHNSRKRIEERYISKAPLSSVGRLGK